MEMKDEEMKDNIMSQFDSWRTIIVCYNEQENAKEASFTNKQLTQLSIYQLTQNYVA